MTSRRGPRSPVKAPQEATGVIRMRLGIWGLIYGGWCWCCPWHNVEGWAPSWRDAMDIANLHLKACHGEKCRMRSGE